MRSTVVAPVIDVYSCIRRMSGAFINADSYVQSTREVMPSKAFVLEIA